MGSGLSKKREEEGNSDVDPGEKKRKRSGGKRNKRGIEAFLIVKEEGGNKRDKSDSLKVLGECWRMAQPSPCYFRPSSPPPPSVEFESDFLLLLLLLLLLSRGRRRHLNPPPPKRRGERHCCVLKKEGAKTSRRQPRSDDDVITSFLRNSPSPLLCSISSSFLMLSSLACRVCFWVSMRVSSSCGEAKEKSRFKSMFHTKFSSVFAPKKYVWYQKFYVARCCRCHLNPFDSSSL